MSAASGARPLWTLYEFFRSLKLALALILILVGLSLIATFIPQGQDPVFYEAQYRGYGGLLVTLGVHRMFTSFLFLLPAGLFFVNLLVCTIHRFITRVQSGARKRYGPDLIHVALLVLMAGAVVTFFGRNEAVVELRVGQSVPVPGGYLLTLDDFIFERYESGLPSDWLSIVTVSRGDEAPGERAVIEVNSPLKVGPLKIYQSSYGLDEGVVLSDAEGNRYWLEVGGIIPAGDAGLVLHSIAAPRIGGNVAVFDLARGPEVMGQRSVRAGAIVGEWVVEEVVSEYYTGLQLVHDPGYLVVLAALIMLTLGLFLTYIQKLGDKRL